MKNSYQILIIKIVATVLILSVAILFISAEYLKTNTARFSNPTRLSTECSYGQTNATKNSINGVLDITFMNNDIKVSLDTIILYIIGFFVFFLLFFTTIFLFIVNKKMVSPVVKLTNEIQNISSSKDLAKRVNIDSDIEELIVLQNSFNVLFETVKFYYDKLIAKLYTDDLTNIHNLLRFNKDIITAQKDSTIISIDIKLFTSISSMFGVKVSDYLIHEFANTTKDFFNKNSTLYRLYGDEFALIHKGEIDPAVLQEYIDLLAKTRFKYKDSYFTLSVTIGYDSNIGSATLEGASNALSDAKSNNMNILQFNQQKEIKDEHISQLEWLKKLNNAIKNDMLIPYFMPMKNTKTKKIDKYESLVRIKDGDKIYTPDKIIDIASSSGLYPLLTQTMIKKTFEYFKDIDNIKFSINLSLTDILNVQTIDILLNYLKEYRYSHNVVIELLETEELSDFILLNNFIKKVKKYGVKIAIDDFGSGYSNFNYILNLDVDIIKLDSCLVKNIFTDQEALIVVSNIVRVAKELKLLVVAEMVYDKHIEEILTAHKVDYLQGYHIGQPASEILK